MTYLLSRKPTLGNKWVFCIMYKVDRTIERYKAVWSFLATLKQKG